MKHYNVICFHCKKLLYQRVDTYKRQLLKYGHHCCKNCFGKEQSFKDARKYAMLLSNPFKGKKHTEKTKNILSIIKIGGTSWNKGLTKDTNEIVRRYGNKNSDKLKLNPKLGENNPNWKGGSSIFNINNDFFTRWLPLRKIILDEDNNTCWKCNNKTTPNKLEIHHLASKAKFPQYRYDRQNCIVLCKSCHKEFHNIYGKINFTPSDTIKWINKYRSVDEILQMC